jgi:HEAT repeat protein
MEQVGPVPEILDGLASALDDPDPAVREIASETLSKHGGARTIEVLVAATESPNQRARFAAVTALGLMGAQAHKALRNIANGSNAILKLEASTLLAEHGDKTGANTVLTTIHTSECSDKKTRRQIDALVSLMQKMGGDEELLKGLAVLLASQATEIRDLIATSLGQIKDSKTVDVLEGVLAGSNGDAKAAAVKSLGLIGDTAHAVLRKVADESDPELQLEAAVLLAEQKDWSRSSAIFNSINSELDKNTLMRLIRSLQGIKTNSDSRTFSDTLTKFLMERNWGKDEDTPFQIAVVLADLGNLPGKGKAEGLFIQTLKSSSWEARRNSAMRLGEMCSINGLGILIKALSDGDYDVRREVAIALGKIGDPSARGALEKAVTDDDNDGVRKAAAKALENLKPK